MAVVVGPQTLKDEIIRRWYMLSALLFYWGPAVIDAPELPTYGVPDTVYSILRVIFRDLPGVRTYGSINRTVDWKTLRWSRWTIYPDEFWIGAVHEYGPAFGSNEYVVPPKITQDQFSTFITTYQSLFEFCDTTGRGPYKDVLAKPIQELERWSGSMCHIEVTDILPMGNNVPCDEPLDEIEEPDAGYFGEVHEYTPDEKQWTKAYPPPYLRMPYTVCQAYIASEPLLLDDIEFRRNFDILM